MTRFSGYRLLGCPACETVHAVANLVSFNLMSFETWTDGQKLHSLMDYREGVRQCSSCEHVFLEREAKFMGNARTRWRNDDEPYDIPAFLLRPANEPTWTWQTVRDRLSAIATWVMRGGLPAPSTVAENAGTAPASADVPFQYPELYPVRDSDLASLVAKAKDYSEALILAIRTLYWRYLNDPYRDTARRLIEKGRDPAVAFTASDLQIENMRALLALLIKHRPEDVLTRAELYRELGEFTAAIDLLVDLDSEDEEANAIREAARGNISAPISIKYAWQSSSKTF
jgi:hypothetical protein